MPRNGSTLKLFAGAPDAAGLTWTEHSTTLRPAFCRFLQKESVTQEQEHHPDSSAPRVPAWRVVPSPAISAFEEFVEHSFEAVSEIESSLTSSLDTHFAVNARLPHNRPLHIRSLSTLPAATTLAARPRHSPYTTDLLVAVLSISSPRTVRVRRTGQSVNLLEFAVADDSGAQLQVTCWLGDETALRTTLARLCLRAGDVVLVTDVALSVFKGTVYAQSIGGGGSGHRRQTDVVLLRRLYEKAGEEVKSGGRYAAGKGAEAANAELVAARLPGLVAWAVRCIAPPLSLTSSFLMRSGEELARRDAMQGLHGKRREVGVGQLENGKGGVKKLRRQIDIAEL